MLAAIQRLPRRLWGFTQPRSQWPHKADYKLQRIPEEAKERRCEQGALDAGAGGASWDGTTQIQPPPQREAWEGGSLAAGRCPRQSHRGTRGVAENRPGLWAQLNTAQLPLGGAGQLEGDGVWAGVRPRIQGLGQEGAGQRGAPGPLSFLSADSWGREGPERGCDLWPYHSGADNQA